MIVDLFFRSNWEMDSWCASENSREVHLKTNAWLTSKQMCKATMPKMFYSPVAIYQVTAPAVIYLSLFFFFFFGGGGGGGGGGGEEEEEERKKRYTGASWISTEKWWISTEKCKLSCYSGCHYVKNSTRCVRGYFVEITSNYCTVINR